ncbi:MAG: response regulator [Desulfobacterales bacterium]|nr:response regulator [Desulfobacterales bacterium]
MKLKHKINGSILLTFILIVAAFSSLQLPFQQKRFHTVMQKAKEVISTLVSRDIEPLANEIFGQRLEAINIRLEKMLELSDVITISVFDAKGLLLCSRGKYQEKEDLSQNDKELLKDQLIIRNVKWFGHSALLYYQEIIIIGEKIGFIKVYYSLDEIERERQLALILFASLLASIFLLLIIFLNLILQKTVVNPLSILKDVMLSLSSGHLGKQITIKSKDEIGSLSLIFNKMSSQIADSYEQIHQQNEALKKMDKMKDQFLANTSHELRTPLNGIIGISESLIDGTVGQIDAIAQKNLKMIANSARRLTKLVNEILDFSKLNEKKLSLNLDSVKLQPLIEEVFKLFDPQVDAKQLQLINSISDDLPPVHADADRLKQILINLIDNAIKFTSQGFVSIEAQLIKNSIIRICVTDSGIGIPDDQLDRIFEEFIQIDGSSTRSFGGTGLGLAITKNLVELHGGKIGVQSVLNKGTAIYFTLLVVGQSSYPIDVDLDDIHIDRFKGIHKSNKQLIDESLSLSKDKIEDQTIEEYEQLNQCSGNILVVDDEPVNLHVVTNHLMSKNYTVTKANSGREALKAIEQTQLGKFPAFDLVLLDIMMPMIDGYEVVKQIRGSYNLFELPILLLTAKNQAKDLAKGFQLGANDYITKPFLKEDLLARVEIHLLLRQTYHQLVDNYKRAKKFAEASAMAKSEFLANMSHEIRTPMNGVIAATDLALELQLDPKVKRYLQIIQSSGYSLLGLINDILDFSKIEAGKLELEQSPFKLDEVLIKVSNILSNKAQEKHIELLIDIDPETPMALIGDDLRIQQIIVNLVGNALKFTPYYGSIIIGVKNVSKYNKNDQVTLEFYVKDNGVGIKQKFLKQIFKPFTQEDGSTTRKFGGTGLGLSICKQLVTKMNGEIWVESIYGQGSTFYFTITLPIQSEIEKEKYTIPAQLKNERVLVVDDSEESCFIITKILKSFGFKPEVALLGIDAIEKIQQAELNGKQFKLITMDFMMPGMSGIEVSRKIRRELKIDTPIIMMTIFGREEEERAKDVGINGFLTKPISPSVFFTTIMNIFGTKNQKIYKQDESITTPLSELKEKLKGMRVLLAEDNLTNQEIASAVLKGAGIEFEIANNGKEAVKKVKNGQFQVVLMDIQMPEMDGYQATRAIREDDSFDNLPIIAMTAHAMKGDAERCLASGMNGYVTKPISQKKLFQTLFECYNAINQSSNSNEEYTSIATENNNNNLPHRLPGLDIKATLDFLSIDEMLFKKILMGFAKDNQTTIDKINKAFNEENWVELGNIAHTLKGSGSNIGAVDLQKKAFALEKACQHNIVFREIVDAMIESLKEVIQSIETLF